MLTKIPCLFIIVSLLIALGLGSFLAIFGINGSITEMGDGMDIPTPAVIEAYAAPLPLTQTLEEDGLTLQYPEGWFASTDYGTIYIASSEALIELIDSSDVPAIPSGEAIFLYLAEAGFSDESPRDVLEIFTEGSDTGDDGFISIGEIEDSSFGDKPGAKIILLAEEAEIALHVLQYDEEMLFMVGIVTHPGEMEQFTMTAERIFLTISQTDNDTGMDTMAPTPIPFDEVGEATAEQAIEVTAEAVMEAAIEAEATEVAVEEVMEAEATEVVTEEAVEAEATETVGEEAPDFSLPDITTDEEITLSDYQGQVVVLNFWGSWCAPCREEAPILQRVYETYQEQDVVFIGIVSHDTEKNALAHIEEFDLTYINVMDTDSALAEAYRTTGVPETFVIGKDGTITRYLYGAVLESELVAAIEAALAQE